MPIEFRQQQQNVLRSSCKVSNIFYNFKGIWNLLTDFHKSLQYQMSRKSVAWEQRWYMRRNGQTDSGRTDGLMAWYHFTRLRAGWSGDRIPVEERFSAPVQTGPGTHSASCTMGTGPFPGGKTAGAWRWPPPSTKVKEKLELYLYSPSGLLWPVLGWNLPFYLLGWKAFHTGR